jgi:hypothetical protein
VLLFFETWVHVWLYLIAEQLIVKVIGVTVVKNDCCASARDIFRRSIRETCWQESVPNPS